MVHKRTSGDRKITGRVSNIVGVYIIHKLFIDNLLNYSSSQYILYLHPLLKINFVFKLYYLCQLDYTGGF